MFDQSRQRSRNRITTLQGEDRYPYTAAQLDSEGRLIETCGHHHGRRDAEAIICAKDRGWDGFAELLITDDAPARALEVWRFRTVDGQINLRLLGMISHADIAISRPRP